MNAIKIHVNRVPDEGLEEHATYDPGALDMERDDIRLREPFEVEAKITKSPRELTVAVEIRCALHMTCARCLTEFTRVVTPAGVFSYRVLPSDVVDITDDVRQEVMLAYPMASLCSPDCKGLCPTCGQNLNAGACPHQPGA